ncbi:MAG: enoyl-CoA hydratase/isomerase family protein [Candidatus Kapaibacterium sp.]
MVHTRVDGRIGIITLANPDKRNALSPEMLGALDQAVTRFSSDDDIHVILFEAQGKVFCAGADLKYMQQIRDNGAFENLEDSEIMMHTFKNIYTSPKIIVAKVQGDAIAGGCGLVTLCDYVVASDTARFGFTEVAIGFVPALVGVLALRKIGEARARHILLRANIFDASEARELGLVYDVCAPHELEDRTNTLVHELAKHPRTSIALTKKLLVHIQDVDVFSGLDYAAGVNALSRQTDSFKNGIDAMIARISGVKTS